MHFCRIEGSESAVNAFILFTTSLSSPGGEPSMKDETMDVDIANALGIWALTDSKEMRSLGMR